MSPAACSPICASLALLAVARLALGQAVLPCPDGSSARCPDGTAPVDGFPPCAGGPPLCADGSVLPPPTGAQPPGGMQGGMQGGMGGPPGGMGSPPGGMGGPPGGMGGMQGGMGGPPGGMGGPPGGMGGPPGGMGGPSGGMGGPPGGVGGPPGGMGGPPGGMGGPPGGMGGPPGGMGGPPGGMGGPPGGMGGPPGGMGGPPGGMGSPPAAGGSKHAAPLLGDVGRTTVAGRDARTGTKLAAGEDIYGPFEAGFGAMQDFVLEALGCSPASKGYVAGGIDTNTSEKMMAHQCNIELPRTENSGPRGYVSLLDECGGHTREYHFHERLSCLYNGSAPGHSARIGQGNDGGLLYGKFEAAGELPQLDACGGHFGGTPESPDKDVYHYHVQDRPPFTFGCYGPNDDGSLVTVEQCREFYPGCDGNVETLQTSGGPVEYDDWCPCFDADGSNTGKNVRELPPTASAHGHHTSKSKTGAAGFMRKHSTEPASGVPGPGVTPRFAGLGAIAVLLAPLAAWRLRRSRPAAADPVPQEPGDSQLTSTSPTE